jgi:hypothetical protein
MFFHKALLSIYKNWILSSEKSLVWLIDHSTYLQSSLLALRSPPPWIEQSNSNTKSCSFVNDSVAQIVCRLCILVLTDYTINRIPLGSQWLIEELVSGQLDWVDFDIPPESEAMVNFQLVFDYPPAKNIADLLLQAVARRTAFEELRGLRNAASPSRSFVRELIKWSAKIDRSHGKRTTCTWAIWLMMQFRTYWDGRCFLNRWEPAGAALEQLNTMSKSSVAMPPALPIQFKWLSDRINRQVIEQFYQYHRITRPPGARRHLFDYPYILKSTKMTEVFKTLSLMSALEQYESSDYINIMRIDLAEVAMAISKNSELNALFRNEFRIPLSRFLRIEVRRSEMFEDAFTALWGRQRRELLKPLQVKISGEIGHDIGGLTNEFFRLVFLEALDPDASMSLTPKTTAYVVNFAI